MKFEADSRFETLDDWASPSPSLHFMRVLRIKDKTQLSPCIILWKMRTSSFGFTCWLLPSLLALLPRSRTRLQIKLIWFPIIRAQPQSWWIHLPLFILYVYTSSLPLTKLFHNITVLIFPSTSKSSTMNFLYMKHQAQDFKLTFTYKEKVILIFNKKYNAMVGRLRKLYG